MTTLQQQITDEIARAKKAEATLAARLAKLEPPTLTLDERYANLSRWRTLDYIGPGQEATFAASQATVAGGVLSITAIRKAGGGWLSGCITTDPVFRQLYGRFGATIKIPKGRGLWPAFWMLDKPFPPAGSPGVAELDIMEILANPLGAPWGNDAARLYSTIHFPTSPQAQYVKQAVDLSLAYHDFEMEWRAAFVAFLLDGTEFARYTGPGIPNVAMPLILDLAVGGKWAGASDATTPSPAPMLVSRVWASA